MQSRTRFIAATLTALAALGIGVSIAGASRLGITNGERGLRLVWTPLAFEFFGGTVTCDFTLEGTFVERTIVKRAGSTIARITTAGASNCTGGTLRVASETLPWTVTFQGFGGSLPRITSITKNLVSAVWEAQPVGLPNCRFRSETSHPVRGVAAIASTGDVEELQLLSELTIPGSGPSCGGALGSFIGTATETVARETAHTQITLI